MQEGKLTHTSFPSWWNNVVQDAPVLVQEGKLACATFPHGGMNCLICTIACARGKAR
jgi:hypothetical protein